MAASCHPHAMQQTTPTEVFRMSVAARAKALGALPCDAPCAISPCFLSLECRQTVIGLLQGGGDDYLELPHPSALGQLPFLEACLLLAAQP